MILGTLAEKVVMKTLKQASLVLVALSMSACGTLSHKDYDRGPAEESQFMKDSAQCEMEAERSRSSRGYGGLTGAAYMKETYDKIYDPCMRSKGYQKK
jgi:hypothetical protein